MKYLMQGVSWILLFYNVSFSEDNVPLQFLQPLRKDAQLSTESITSADLDIVDDIWQEEMERWTDL